MKRAQVSAGIVSQKAAEGNIAAADGCGKTVEFELNPLMALEKVPRRAFSEGLAGC